MAPKNDIPIVSGDRKLTNKQRWSRESYERLTSAINIVDRVKGLVVSPDVQGVSLDGADECTIRERTPNRRSREAYMKAYMKRRRG